VGFFLIPHPPLANWLLRRGLSEKNRETLTFIHEFMHLQSAPFVLLYAFLMFILASSMAQTGFTQLLLILICSQASWEFGAEILTYLNDKRFYRRCYGKISLLPRIVFWFVAGVTAITAWLIVLP